ESHPDVLRACAGFALLVRDLATAQWCGHRALALGADSTWHLLRLAWVEAGWGTEEAVAGLFTAAVQAAGSEAGLAAISEAMPGGVRPSKVAMGRWVADDTYRDSVVMDALGVQASS